MPRFNKADLRYIEDKFIDHDYLEEDEDEEDNEEASVYPQYETSEDTTARNTTHRR